MVLSFTAGFETLPSVGKTLGMFPSALRGPGSTESLDIPLCHREGPKSFLSDNGPRETWAHSRDRTARGYHEAEVKWRFGK